MKLIHILDNDGFFIESKMANESYELLANETDTTPGGMQMPMWNGTTWVETAPKLHNIAVGNELISNIRESYESEMETLTDKYSPQEKKTWNTQLTQASLFLADSTAITTGLDELALARNIPKAVIAQKIVDNANTLTNVSLALTGKYQRLIKDIKKLQSSKADASEYKRITWS